MSRAQARHDELVAALAAVGRRVDDAARDEAAERVEVEGTLRELGQTLAGVAADVGRQVESDPVADAYRSHVVTRRVVVNLTTGAALHGILVNASGPLLELANAEYIAADGRAEGVDVDGRAIVERDRVEFIQVV